MTCPFCTANNSEIECNNYVRRKDVSGFNYEGFDEIYTVVCPECNQEYTHIEQYQITHDGSVDLREV